MPTTRRAKALSREAIPDKLMRAKQRAVSQLLSAGPTTAFAAMAASTEPEHNVVGVGIGRKIKGGKETNELAVRVYVERKVAKELIPKRFLLPAKIEGVKLDVIETGRFRTFPGIPVGQQRLRPARPGCSIGFQFRGAMAKYVMAGTFGAVVQSKGVQYVLSNNHVLANENGLPIGSLIFQPGLLDHGNVRTDVIAKLAKFVRLSKTGMNSVDCAIAEIIDPKRVSATFLPSVGRLKSATPVSAVVGMRVHKVGRTTGFTTGRVFDVSVDVAVDYDLGRLTFNDQILIRGNTGSFSAAGDSGSGIVDRGSGRATGLLFAGSSSYTIANHMADVLGKLHVQLVV
jgi:hypothetical protein